MHGEELGDGVGELLLLVVVEARADPEVVVPRAVEDAAELALEGLEGELDAVERVGDVAGEEEGVALVDGVGERVGPLGRAVVVVVDVAAGPDADGGRLELGVPLEEGAPFRRLEAVLLDEALEAVELRGRVAGVARVEARGLGRKRVIQRRFNVSVPRARVPKKDVHVRDRSER